MGMFQNLADKLSNAFKKFRNKGKLTEADVKEGMREIKLALLEADVSFKVVKDFIKKVTERAVGSQVLESLLPGQQVVKIVHEELIELMGKTQAKLEIASKPPTVISGAKCLSNLNILPVNNGGSIMKPINKKYTSMFFYRFPFLNNQKLFLF